MTTNTSSRGALRAEALVLEREHQPLDAGAEADPGRRRAADLLDEAVVAPAARDHRALPLSGPTNSNVVRV